MKNLLYCLVLMVVFTACGQGKEAKTVPAQNATFSQPGVNPDEQAKTDASASNINPPHGQPGHRCDIPEGAPLSSPAVDPSVPVQSQQNNVTVTPVTNTASPVTPVTNAIPSGTAKLNPAHGEPGHDCNIPVGQPLAQ